MPFTGRREPRTRKPERQASPHPIKFIWRSNVPVNRPFFLPGFYRCLGILLIPSLTQADKSPANTNASPQLPAFRTDANPDDESVPWFQLTDGKFPPTGSAHAISGELIRVDHLERNFVLRVDRSDRQNRSHFDLPLWAEMLPYGSIYYHGAPAALEDIPLGTHLHGQFYLKHPDDKRKPLETFHNRVSPEAAFTRCFRLEDDFSYHQRRGEIWRIDETQPEAEKLTVTLLTNSALEGKAATFDLPASPRIWVGRQIGRLTDLKKDQQIQFNITWATLYGPGRIREIWIDEESRKLATDHQQKKHRIQVRQRGLPGWVNTVDNRERLVTITFFDTVDPSLFKSLKMGQSAGIAVARSSLMTYDPVNDRKSGPITARNEVTKQPGGSTVQIQVQPSLLLEGYRPGRIVRVYPSGWPVIALPKEERFFGR